MENKNININIILSILLIFSFTSIAFSKDRNFKLEKVSLKYNFIFEEIALPFTQFLESPVHLGSSIGAEYKYREKKHSSFYQDVNLGFFIHKPTMTAIYLNTHLGYRFQFNFGLNFSYTIGIGYLHNFSYGSVYEQNSDGEFYKATNKGNPMFTPSTCLELGYNFNKKTKLPLSLFTQYAVLFEIGKWNEYIPLLPHTQFHIGIRYQLKKNKQKLLHEKKKMI